MKKLKILVVICIVFFATSCDNDSVIENKNLIYVKSLGAPGCDLTIYIDYNFGPFVSEDEKVSLMEAYKLEMSQYFTICTELGVKGCPDIEKWMVNSEEYNNYLSMPKGTGTSGNNREGDPDFDPEAVPINPCF